MRAVRREAWWIFGLVGLGCGGSVADPAGSTAAGGTGQGGSGGTGASDAGAPDRCQLLPDPGPCDAAMTRFHFDPAYANCREFTYGGCEGNANNFADRFGCMIACQRGAVSCNRCRPDGGCVDDCSGCPKMPNVDGLPCDEPNYECYFGDACSIPHCTCATRSTPTSQSLVWNCTTNLC